MKKLFRYLDFLFIASTLSVFFIINQKTLSSSNISIPLFIAEITLIHSLKFIRSYFILSGKGISIITHLKIYTKSIPISIILPYKLGEIYRAICYSQSANQTALKFFFLIAIDRFFDTLALFLVLFVISKNNFIIFNIIFFLLILIGTFFISFPYISDIWKNYFLKTTSSRRNLAFLSLLQSFDKTYSDLKLVFSQNGMIAIFLSLIAWATEIFFLYINKSIYIQGTFNEYIHKYLESEFFGSSFEPLIVYNIISVGTLYLVHFCILAINHIYIRKSNNGK